MSNSAMTISDGEACHRLQTTHRDWGLLFGHGFAPGWPFMQAFGVYDNFTIARGIPQGSHVTRMGRDLLVAAEALAAAIARDAELLRYDYSYGFAGSPVRHGGGQSISINGRHGSLTTNPKGYCQIEFRKRGKDGRLEVEEIMDLRVVPSVETDSGIVKAYRRKASIAWLDILPPLITFLSVRQAKELTIEHHDRVP